MKVGLLFVLTTGLCLSAAPDDSGDARFRAGSTSCYPDGQLREFELAESSAVDNVWLPVGTRVFNDTAGRLMACCLPHRTVIQDCPCGPSRMGLEGVLTWFYPDGRLKSTVLSEPAEIQGIPCRAGSLSGVTFYPDGRLKSGWLSRSFSAEEKTYAPGTRLEFDPAGNVTGAHRRGFFRQLWVSMVERFL